VSERESWPGSDGPDLDESMEDVRVVLGEEREDEPDEPPEDTPEDEPEEKPQEGPEEGPEDSPIHQLRGAEHAEGELNIPPHVKVLEGSPNGSRRGVAFVVARFNGEITSKLLESALAEADAAGVAEDAITVMPVPGAFELPLAAMALAKTRRYACVVALGCVIRGETPHFDYVAGEAASGLQLAALETGVPVSFGVLTVESIEQAEARVDKGAEAVRTALEMADLFAQLRASAQAAQP
jgi:6,7-dimethyl-8-ribityllumazine synthase